MNFKINLTVAKLRRTLLIAALVASPFLAQTGKSQDASGVLAQQGTGLTTFSITSNQTFTLTLNITTSFASNGITFFLGTGANGSNLFQITARTPGASTPPNNTALYGDATSSDGAVFGAGGRLNQFTDVDLGYTNFTGDPNDTNPDPAGSNLFVCSISLSALGLAPGQYTIFLTGNGNGTGSAIISDVNFADHNLVTNTVTLNVIPEPTTVGLAIMGGGMLLVMGLRRYRAARA